MKKALVIILVWFLVINIFAAVALNRLNLEKDSAYQWITTSDAQVEEQTWNPVPWHAQWDSYWLMSIADKGYEYQQDELSNIAFFPLYPILIKLVSFMVGDFILAGWLVSIIFLFLSTLMLYRLVKEFHPSLNPYLPVIFLLVFPTAFFLNAIYSEATFLFFSVTTFYYLLKKKYWQAGLAGLLAALTRPNGILLIIPFGWELFQEFRRRNYRWSDLPATLLIPTGTFIYFSYIYFRFGDFLAFLKVEKAWGRAFVLDWSIVDFTSSAMVANFALDISFTLFAIIGACVLIKKLRASYGLYVLAAILVPLATGTLMSIGRFVLVLFPLFILPATIKSELGRTAWLIVSTLLLALYTLLFATNYWAG